jgi:hypothetical protein
MSRVPREAFPWVYADRPEELSGRMKVPGNHAFAAYRRIGLKLKGNFSGGTDIQRRRINSKFFGTGSA